jgi:hypothetical protein
MTVNQALDCVRTGRHATCPAGQRQAAEVLAAEVVWLRLQFAAIQKIVINGVDVKASGEAAPEGKQD